ncbi:MAG: hypothetical protein ABI132_04500 [Rhodanobacteraceae bacterium]
MTNQVVPENPRDTARAAARIETGAERFKDGTSQTVQTAKEKFNTAADSVEHGVHKATDASASAAIRATEKAVELRERSREALGEARQRASEMADGAKERASDAFDSMREFVRERPAQSVAIALAAGWLLGRLVGRR